MAFAGMALSETDGKVFLSVEPVDRRECVDAIALHDWLVLEGFGGYQLHHDALERVAKDSAVASSRFVLLVAQRSDAAIGIQVALDAMSAALTIHPAQGGRPANSEDVINALTLAGVVAGIDETAVGQAVAAGTCEGLVVARGALPEDGHDAEFEELIPATPDRTPKLDENGLIDYREHDGFVMVHTGALLMRRKPATPGTAGFTVRGDVLAAKPGLDEPFAPQLAGAKVSDDDPNLLQACLTGQPVRVHGGVMVEPVLRLAEVSMATGNIYYEGTVHVEGDIAQEMKVEAGGDIVVGGLVDGGLLQAGGDINVAGGVIAHARLHAQGSIAARFAEASLLHAGTVIAIHDMAMECELQSLNQILIGTGSPRRGRLIGGRATAMMLIKTPLLGSPTSGVTHLVLGANPVLEARYRDLLARLEQERVAQESLRKLIAQLTASGDPRSMLGRAQASLDHACSTHAQTQLQRDEVEQQLALSRSATVEVGVGVVGAADLAFGKVNMPLRREFRAGNFRLDAEGVLVYTDGSGYAVPVLP
ncbi:DUF342 domain-containing protein [Simplicispira suum]|uniref:Flagellar Assembly Protein A N-terminal region domain-containing protein n=1 Tax=Simplicispira suum TaxID=2109915 RepID=A0A2S0N1U0_9BURK|nr:FapA family protein [Simplicispira suum]AVO41883.1 hypothetical protein C6571_11865 [Simplicispira suum]MBW7832779.1 DUF342 domain-containing protein [Simplicispira suum]